MAKILRPRRGLKQYATSQNIVLAKGEVFFAYGNNNYGTTNSINEIYLGDGSTSFSNLKPFINNSSVDYASTSDYSSKASSATKATKSMASSYVKLNEADDNHDYCIGLFDDSPATCYSCYYTDGIVLNPKKKYISTRESNSSSYQSIDINYKDITKTDINKTNNSTLGWNGSTINSLDSYLNYLKTYTDEQIGDALAASY